MRNTRNNEIDSIEFLGIRVDLIDKDTFINLVDYSLQSPGYKYVVTPYSEFYLAIVEDKEFQSALQNSYLSICDGVYVQWVSKFLSLPTHFKGFFKTVEIITQYILTGISLIIYPKYCRTIVKERLSGALIIDDICKLAIKRNYKLAFLGGFDFGSGNTGSLAAQVLKEKFPKLQITEVYPGDRKKEVFDEEVVPIMKDSKADILLCCYAPIRQEKWMAKYLEQTGIKLGIGLGGTFDYISNVKRLPSPWMLKVGLGWLFRPFLAEGFNIPRLVKRMKRSWMNGFLRASTHALKVKIENKHVFKIYKRNV